MLKDKLFGAACSAFAGVYFSEYAKTKDKSALCFAVVYTILAIAWGAIAARDAEIGVDE